MPETNRAVLYVPARVDLPAGLAHETQRTNVSASLTEFSRNVKWARISDESGGDIFTDLTDLIGRFEVYRFSADLVSVLAYCGLRNSQAFCHYFLFHSITFHEFTGYHGSQCRND